jgi:hypothetical protein
MMPMNAKLKKLALTLTATMIFLSFTLVNVKIAFSNDPDRKIDVFTQKIPFNGKGINQSSDTFQPQELVVLYALVTYNEDPVGNMLVAFQINNPANAFQNITIVGVSSTNQSGIAQFSFRIPWPVENAEQIIFGNWFAIVTVDIAGQVAVDTLKFQVGWIIKITKIRTLNANLEPQTKYLREEVIVFNLTLENIALTAKSATIIIDAQDVINYPIIHLEMDSIIFQPGENFVCGTSQISTIASIGEAMVSATAYTASPKIGGVPYSPAAVSTFTIITSPVKQYYLTVKTDPVGIVPISGEGWYDEGTNVPLTAPEYVSVSLGARYKFSYWDVDGIPKQGNPIAVTMDANHTATAHYISQYYLTVKTDPTGVATILGEGWYDQGENVTLAASLVEGYDFAYWDVDGVSRGTGVNITIVHMDGPHVAMAHYSLRIGGWYVPEWFYWFLLWLLLLIIILLIAWLYRRRRKKNAEETFNRGWTAWYYRYDLRGKVRKIFDSKILS